MGTPSRCPAWLAVNSDRCGDDPPTATNRLVQSLNGATGHYQMASGDETMRVTLSYFTTPGSACHFAAREVEYQLLQSGNQIGPFGGTIDVDLSRIVIVNLGTSPGYYVGFDAPGTIVHVRGPLRESGFAIYTHDLAGAQRVARLFFAAISACGGRPRATGFDPRAP